MRAAAISATGFDGSSGRSRVLSWYAGYTMLRGALGVVIFGAMTLRSGSSGLESVELAILAGIVLWSLSRVIIGGGLLARQPWALWLELARQSVAVATSVLLAGVPAVAGLIAGLPGPSGTLSEAGARFMSASIGMLVIGWLLSRKPEFTG